MNFKEAYDQLRMDKKIRRKAWDKSIYIQMNSVNQVKCYREEAVPFVYDITIINSNDWIIVSIEDVSIDNISFDELIEYLRKGYRAKLPEWPDDCHIESSKDGNELFMRRICEYEFTPTFSCFTSNDWEII
jgi:hypothetical protein